MDNGKQIRAHAFVPFAIVIAKALAGCGRVSRIAFARFQAINSQIRNENANLSCEFG